MYWKDAKDIRDAYDTTIQAYFVDGGGHTLAWVSTKGDQFYWLQYDDKPPRGPFQTLAAAQLACQIHYSI